MNIQSCEAVTNENSNSLSSDIGTWRFSINTLCSLPLDEIENDNTVRSVRNAVFSKVDPSPLEKDPKLVAISKSVLVDILDMDPSISDTNGFLKFLSGYPVTNSNPLSHRYGGYQFGEWSSQLGDGRAHILGEYINAYV